MFSTASLLTLGFLLGMRHATDPDHVVAVATIVSGRTGVLRASAIGALWGIGHTTTLLLVGGAILLFELAIPPRLGLALEFLVAVMLVILGVRSLLTHEHGHAARQDATRPLTVGFVHGLAGSAFVAMLVLTRIHQPVVGLLYLLVFGVGTIAGMAAVTASIAVPSAFVLARIGHGARHLRFAAGLVSVAFGLFLAHRIGVVDGLFGANPTWDPH
jgi:hypothetical protein